MPSHFLSTLQASKSIFLHLDPRTKIILVFAFILSLSFAPSGQFLVYLTLYLLLIVCSILSGFGYLRLAKRSFIVLPFAVAAATLPFTIPGQPIAVIPIAGGLTISIEGTIRFLSVIIKSWISVQAAVLMIGTTSFSELLWGLQALWVPKLLVSVVGFTYRYLDVLRDEANRLMRAREARSAYLSSGKKSPGLLWRGKVAGRMVGTLLMRTIERGERIYLAMAARNYTGQILTLSHPHMGTHDALFLFFGLLLLLTIALISNL